MVPVGAGGSMGVPAVTAMLLDRVPAERTGTASGVLNTSRQIDGALPVAVLGALLANQADFLDGMRISLLTGAAVLATAVTALLLRPAQRR